MSDRTDDDLDDDLEGGLLEAFKAEPGETVLGAISRLHGAGNSILLRETEDDAAPILFQGSKAEASDDSRYQITGEIARGGIGIIYRARDRDLNRDIALKVLRPEYADREDVIERFIEEAQVGGQLQHPGIVPVYGLTLQSDGRPSFAMKLIKGRTLAELLESNPLGIDLLSVFEQIAMTLAYTHSRRVIHRDLKPANVMIGAFGEVQVVDWGFGKVLGRAEAARRPEPEATIIATLRSGSGNESLAGSVMGTPAYMPPEQALGHIDDLDERADVFALGAILCEILSGEAPYTGGVQDQLIAAAQCRLDEAHKRIDEAEGPEPLKQLTRDCLQPLTKDRPRSAAVVADRMAAYFAAVDERARQSELDAIEAETTLSHEETKRKRVLVLAGIATLAIATIGGGYFWWKSSRDAREAEVAPLVAAALREATSHEGQGDWAGAVASAQRAADLARAEGVDGAEAEALLARLEEERREHDTEASLRADDDALLAELVGIRNLAPGSTKVGVAEGGSGSAASATDAWERPADRHKAMDAAYVSAFEKRFGSVAAGRDRLKASRHASDFAANLSYWSWLRKTMNALAGSDWESIHALADEIDPVHARIRTALLADDPDELIAAVDEKGAMLPLALVSQVARALTELDRPDDAIEFLRPWHRRHPDEMVISVRYAGAARARGEYELAIRHAAAAVAIQPEVDLGWYVLGRSLLSAGEFEEAIEAFRQVVELTPRYLDAYAQLADAYIGAHQPDGALGAVEWALRAFPSETALHIRRGWILTELLGRHDDAIAAYRVALELDPEPWSTYTNLALAYARHGDADQAREAFEQALGLEPDLAVVHAEVARSLIEMGAFDESIVHNRKAIELDPTQYSAQFNIGYALTLKGEIDAAIAAYEAAIEIDPDSARAYVDLSRIYEKRREYPKSLAYAQKAVELNPSSAKAHASLALGLFASGNWQSAAIAYRRALELDPTNPRNLLGLAYTLTQMEDWPGALDAYRALIALDPDNVGYHVAAGVIQCDELDRYDDAIETFEHALELDPTAVTAKYNIGIAQSMKGDLDAAAAAFREVAELEPGPRGAYMLGRTHMEAGDWDDAIAAFRDAVKRATDATSSYGPRARAYLGLALSVKGDDAGARAVFEEAVELSPEYALARSLLGNQLAADGDLEGADRELTKAVEIDSRYRDELDAVRRLVELASRLPAVLEGTDKPEYAEEAIVFARLARTLRKDYPGSLKLFIEAFRLDPLITDHPSDGYRYDAARVAVLAGEASYDQALEWLRADLDAFEEQLEMEALALRMWLPARKFDRDFAAVRDVDSVPAAWKRYWADLDVLIERAKEMRE